jgi:translation initiation factor 2B subunit (eIF-2B alpha/beta/delta family)
MEMVRIPKQTQKIAEDIRTMRTRGAGRIARAAAKGLMTTTQESKAKRIPALLRDVALTAQLLYETRPSAVSLPNALRYYYTRLLTRSDKAKGSKKRVRKLDKLSLKCLIMLSRLLVRLVHG